MKQNTAIKNRCLGTIFNSMENTQDIQNNIYDISQISKEICFKDTMKRLKDITMTFYHCFYFQVLILYLILFPSLHVSIISKISSTEIHMNYFKITSTTLKERRN